MQEKLKKGKTIHANPIPRLPDVFAEEKPKLTREAQDKLNIELVQASVLGRITAVEWLIRAGADVNAFFDHKTSLMWAASNGYTGTCALLIEKGANIEALDIMNGCTALRLAALHGQTDTCAFLLDCGASLEAEIKLSWNNGWTSLMYAADGGHARTCALLISRCAKAGISTSQFVNATSAHIDDGKTALHHAAKKGHTKACAVLVSHGAVIFQTDNATMTALNYAEDGNKEKTAAFLKSMGLMQNKLGEEIYAKFISAFGECTTI